MTMRTWVRKLFANKPLRPIRRRRRPLTGVPDVTMEISGAGEIWRFANPSEALVIKGLRGSDTITVHSVDPAFAAELLVYGNHEGAPSVPDLKTDSVVFAGDVDTQGNYLEVFAEAITVNDGVSLTTSGPAVTFDPASAIDLANGTIKLPGSPFPVGDELRYSHVRGNDVDGLTNGAVYVVAEMDSDLIYLADADGARVALTPGGTGTEHRLTRVGSDIVFRARRISTAELENLAPGLNLTKSVSIDIGAGASLAAVACRSAPP